ncbi:hypothetical protein LF1_58550 [Rubripirellula obstinata]|uniref:Uncharacterized protein n=1 Tax=Rubripirellula obstinata TaxID=406547 RepID=A0A5B1C708_9BACT|nr:hypothetical protein LF1_58550 [Rubripirellula obstinata]
MAHQSSAPRGHQTLQEKNCVVKWDSSAELDLIAIAFACACYPTGTYKSDAYNRILAAIRSGEYNAIPSRDARLVVHEWTYYNRMPASDAFSAGLDRGPAHFRRSIAPGAVCRRITNGCNGAAADAVFVCLHAFTRRPLNRTVIRLKTILWTTPQHLSR